MNVLPLLRYSKKNNTVIPEHEFYLLFEGQPVLSRVVDRRTIIDAIKQLQELVGLNPEEEEIVP